MRSSTLTTARRGLSSIFSSNYSSSSSSTASATTTITTTTAGTATKTTPTITKTTKTTSLLTTLLFAVVLSATTVTAQSAPYRNDFSLYPQTAQACLQKSADNTTCTGQTHAEINACLCAGTDVASFPVRSAICIGRAAPGDLWAVYALIKADCDDTKTPLAYTRGRFMQTAFDAGTTFVGNSEKGSTKPAGAALAVESATAPANDVAQSNTGELSMMAKTGIIVGCAVVGSLFGAFITYWLLLRKKKDPSPGPRMYDVEKRPMMVSRGMIGPPGYGASNLSISGATALGSPREWPATARSFAMSSPSMPGGSMRTTGRLGAPSPMTPQGQWMLDPSTGEYVLAAPGGRVLATAGSRMPPLYTPPLPTPPLPVASRPLPSPPPVPVEAPGTELPFEMPSNQAAVPTWVRHHPNDAGSMQNSQPQPQPQPQPYPIRTSLFPQARQGLGEDDSPSSIYSQNTVAVPQTPAGANLTRNKSVAHWI